jgi:hypothetical protein
MRTLFLLALLAFGSASAAPPCTVKPGFMAGGLVKQTSGLRPECGEYGRTFNRLMGLMIERATQGSVRSWQEIFSGDPKTAKPAMESIGVGLDRAGYRFLNQERSEDGQRHMMMYVHPTTNNGLIVVYFIEGGRFYTGFIGFRL